MKFLKIIIVLFGLSRFIGDTFRITTLEKIGFASGVSPLPLVFSDRQGIEDFAHEIKVTFKSKDQEIIKFFNQDSYSKIEGPLSRVGVYSIALAYSPRFPKVLWENVLQNALCKQGAIYHAFELTSEIQNVLIEITHLKRKELKWKIPISCQ